MKKPQVILGFLFCLLFVGFVQAQDPMLPSDKKERGEKAASQEPKNVIATDTITQKGFFSIHKVNETYFFEIPDSLLGRDILIVGRVARSSAVVEGLYGGDQISNTVVRFEKGPGKKLFLIKVAYDIRSKDSTQAMYKAVERSNMQSVVAVFPVMSYSRDSGGSIIDVTNFINTDNELLYFSSIFKQKFKLGGQLSDRSYVQYVLSYPMNIEIRTTKTYNHTGKNGNNIATLELNASLLLLPKIPMKIRFEDSRIGYFSTAYTDYDANPQGVKERSIAIRWRLEPKPEDVKKYLRGELVEPRKPIVFYIDPVTPKKWVPYLIQGVNDWQKAFEKAGFKNAIMAKMAPMPEEDSTWSLEDARHAAIVYKASNIPNASGPYVADPRSGEIIESHINWNHNIMKLIHDWYFIQCGAVDPQANHMVFNDQLMGKLIRFVSSHEVGHTLGLLHNFASSSTTPVEKLRDNKWLTLHGHTPSIMDYARFNYVAQPEDKIDQQNLFPRIGDYDIWAIEWGYRWYPEDITSEKEIPILNKLIIERLKNKRLLLGHERSYDDPRSQSEDLGDNQMKANEYGIKNLKRIAKNLVKWTSEPNEDYGNLEEMYKQLNAQMALYCQHVARYIGGIYKTLKTVEQTGPVFEYVPASLQKEAVSFLDRHFFTTPDWLIDDNILNKLDQNPAKIVFELQSSILDQILNVNKFDKLMAAEASGVKDCYKLADFFDDLRASVWKELEKNRPISIFRRNLQRTYIERLTVMITSPLPPKNDSKAVIKMELRSLHKMIKNALPNTKDSMTYAHLQDVLERIDNALELKTN